MLIATVFGIALIPALYALCQRVREFVSRRDYAAEALAAKAAKISDAADTAEPAADGGC